MGRWMIAGLALALAAFAPSGALAVGIVPQPKQNERDASSGEYDVDNYQHEPPVEIKGGINIPAQPPEPQQRQNEKRYPDDTQNDGQQKESCVYDRIEMDCGIAANKATVDQGRYSLLGVIISGIVAILTVAAVWFSAISVRQATRQAKINARIERAWIDFGVGNQGVSFDGQALILDATLQVANQGNMPAVDYLISAALSLHDVDDDALPPIGTLDLSSVPPHPERAVFPRCTANAAVRDEIEDVFAAFGDPTLDQFDAKVVLRVAVYYRTGVDDGLRHLTGRYFHVRFHGGRETVTFARGSNYALEIVPFGPLIAT